jgi:hypothetical protein
MTRTIAQHRTDRLCILTCGGHNFDDRVQLTETLDRLYLEHGFARVIAGGTRGAAKLTREWANSRGVACDVYHADRARFGRNASRIRNEHMLAEGKPCLVVAFSGGHRTARMVRIARNAGIEVIDIAPRSLRARTVAMTKKVVARLLGVIDPARDGRERPAPTPGRPASTVARARVAVRHAIPSPGAVSRSLRRPAALIWRVSG